MAVLLNNCGFNPTAGGTTNWTYASPIAGYNSPAEAGIANGIVVKYHAFSADRSQWEIGEGAYNTAGAGSLARTTVMFNSLHTGTTGSGQSGAGTKINFTAAPTVIIVGLAEDLLTKDGNLSGVASAQTSRQNIGVNQGEALAASQNFNSVVTSGTYYTVDSTSTNAPAAGFYWYLTVICYSATNYTVQMATRLESGSNAETYVRTQLGGTWGSWHKVMFGDQGVIFGLTNHSLAVSASGSALTISLKDNAGSDPSAASPVVGNFRNVTGAAGSWTQLLVTSALSLVISSGSTLGVTSSTAFRLWVVLFNDGGTARLGVINCCDGIRIYPLVEGIPASSTAEGGAGAADNAGVFYTGAAVSAKSFLIVGYVEWSASGLTAGTWTTTNVNFIQSFGPGIKKPGDVVQGPIRNSTVVQTDTTSTSYVATNLGLSIAPTSAANMIELIAAGCLLSTASVTAYAQLHRAGTAIGQANSEVAAGVNVAGGVGLNWLDKPNTTSSTLYDVRVKSSSASISSFPYTAGGQGGTILVREFMA